LERPILLGDILDSPIFCYYIHIILNQSFSVTLSIITNKKEK